jgi:hypothetical protein
MRPSPLPNALAPTMRGAGAGRRPERDAADRAKLFSTKRNLDFAMLTGTR